MSEEKEGREQERFRWLKGWRRWVLVIALCALATLGTFLWGIHYGSRASEPRITGELIGQQLRAVEELVSLEYSYTNVGRFEDQVDFYGWKVPFTSKKFIVAYDGCVKAGVDLAEAEIHVNPEKAAVSVQLPHSQILSHEIPEDSIEVFDETKNIFNPISIQDYTGFTKDQKNEIEVKILSDGFLEEADEKARTAVEAVLTVILEAEGYTLEVTTEK